MSNFLSQSIFSDLKAQGASEDNILEMLGVKKLPQTSPSPSSAQNKQASNTQPANANNVKININVKQTEPQNRDNQQPQQQQQQHASSLITDELISDLFYSIQSGNRETIITSPDFQIMKRNDYSPSSSSSSSSAAANSSFTDFPNGIYSFIGRKANIPLFSNAVMMHENPISDHPVLSSLVFNHSSLQFYRKLLPLPPSKFETSVVVAENFSLLFNPSFSPFVMESNRNEVIGQLRVIDELIGNEIGNNETTRYPSNACLDANLNTIYFPIVHSSSCDISVVAFNVNSNHLNSSSDQSTPLIIHYPLYSFDLTQNINLEDDDSLSLFSSSLQKGNRVKSDKSKLSYEMKVTAHWLILIAYNDRLNEIGDNKIVFYFIEKSSVKLANDSADLMVKGDDLIAYKVEIEVGDDDAVINDITIAYDDGNAANVCISVMGGGKSFQRFERIERTDKLRSKPSSSSFNPSSPSRSSFNRSFSASSSMSSSIMMNNHHINEAIIGFPCGDQNSNEMKIKQYFVDPRNPPALQISREFTIDKSKKGMIACLTNRSQNRSHFIYLSLGCWPELDIQRTCHPSNWNHPPPSRQFPALFSECKEYNYSSPTWISGATFIPKSTQTQHNNNNRDNNHNSPLQFSDDDGFIVLSVVTAEDGKANEEIHIFDSSEFENGPAFVIRSFSLNRQFGFGISNFSGSWVSFSDL